MFKSVFVSMSIAAVLAASTVTLAHADDEVKGKDVKTVVKDEARVPASQKAESQDDETVSETGTHDHYMNVRDRRF